MDVLLTNLGGPLSRLFVQLLVIIVTVQVLERLFARLGQPAVVGEMAAGAVLDPSLFELLAPGAFGFVFPGSSLPVQALRLGNLLRCYIDMITKNSYFR
ncbi:MAG TPA: hypothetical protein VGC79_17475 [Polyangiaceae bacterium]